MFAISVVIITILTMILSLLLFPKVHFKHFYFDTYWVIIVIGALILLVTNNVDINALWAGLINSDAMNPLKLVILFIMMTFFSLLLDELGFFAYMAYVILKRVKDSQRHLFLSLYILVSLLTIITSNDVIILTFTPLVIYFAKGAKINPLPYLFGILTAANTWSLTLIIGNPTNMYLALNENIVFYEYFKVMVIPAFVAGISGLGVLLIMFWQDLKKPLFNEVEVHDLKEKPLVVIAVSFMVITLILLALANFLNFELYLIVLIMAVILSIVTFIYYLLKKKPITILVRSYERAPWAFIPLVLGMYVLVIALKEHGGIEFLSNILNNGDPVVNYGVGSFIFSNLMNNQPMSMLFSEMLITVSDANRLKAMYASVIGSNLGVLFTPLGALAGLMWMDILKQNGVSLSFGKYIKNAALIGLITLFCTLFTFFLIL